MFRSRLVRIVLTLGVVGVLGAIACIAPPFAVTRALALATSGWLITGPLEEDGRVVAAGKRLLGAYVQMGLAAEIADRIAARTTTDEEFLIAAMTVVRDNVLNQSQWDHIPRRWPVLVAGAGFCNQSNGAVAMIAARRFEMSQLYALYDPVKRESRHTVGRAWSAKRGEWLYFDASWDVPVLYTRDAEGRPHYIEGGYPAPIARRTPPDRRLYEQRGWILAEMKPTFLGYAIARLPGRVASPPPNTAKDEAVAPNLAGVSIVPIMPLPPRTKLNDAAFARVSRDYVNARLVDLTGGDAAEMYREIAKDPAAAADDRVAELAILASQFAAE